MKSVRISTRELDLLHGLPHLAQLLYLVFLRPRAGYRNGMVGSAAAISYWAMCESLEVQSQQGRHKGKAGKPTVDALRNAIDRLVQAGLAERRGGKEVLLFFLPFVVCGVARPTYARR